MLGPEYYNKALKYVSRPLEKSPLCHIYEAVEELVPDNSCVLDLGCGTERFAKALLNTKAVRYI